jgi:5-formyltetrahydrofolate cyclo-ligase
VSVEGRKQAVRERVWRLLEKGDASRFPGAQGRIPNFRGAEIAAEGLAELLEWRNARAIKANPDAPQLPVRTRALQDGKVVYMAVPRLREPRPFLRLDPSRLRVPARRAASIRGAAEHGRPVRVEDLRIDLVVCGTVAVNRRGVRIGKGGGYSDLELGLLIEAGRISNHVRIVTTVHPLQLLDEDLPETRHDFRVDLIVTPDEVIRTRRARRPPGILWDHLDEGRIDEIPALAALGRSRAR